MRFGTRWLICGFLVWALVFASMFSLEAPQDGTDRPIRVPASWSDRTATGNGSI